MQDIKQRELKIQEKRKLTPWRDFVKEIASRQPVSFYRNEGIICRFSPNNGRVKNILSGLKFEEIRDNLPSMGEESLDDRNFFDVFGELQRQVPLPELQQQTVSNENCSYTEATSSSKNAYLSFLVDHSENVIYSFSVKSGNDVHNSVAIWNENNVVYNCTAIVTSSNIFYSRFIDNCYNIWFSSGLVGCQDCIFCHDLQNQKYCINNKILTKEEYEKERENILKQKDKFQGRYKDEVVSRGDPRDNNNSGIGIIQSENIENGIVLYHIRNARNVILSGGKSTKENFYDSFAPGAEKDFYATIHAAGWSSNIYCSAHAYGSSSIYYSYYLHNCSFCLGCIGLKNKQFCILNKQYTKEERFVLADKIFKKMESDGIFGEFFPGYLNPFYFNDTAAYLIDDSFTKDEVEKNGFLRRDKEIKVDIPTGAEVVDTKDLNKYQGFNDKGERQINPEILKKVIEDEKGDFYRVVKTEYDFLIKYGLPIPKIHWLERIKLGFRFK